MAPYILMASEILTERLILRPLAVTHAPALHAIRSQKEAHKFYYTGPFESLDEAKEWVHENTTIPRSLIYTILLKDETNPPKVIGFVGLNKWDKINFMLDPEHWNLGYATEALAAFLEVLFEKQPNRLSIGTVTNDANLRSKRVLEKCGFVSELPWNSVYAPTSPEIVEQDELDLLNKIVRDSVESTALDQGDRLFFRYMKPVYALQMAENSQEEATE